MFGNIKDVIMVFIIRKYVGFVMKDNNDNKKFFNKIFGFIDTMSEDKIGIYAAQSAFFIILSIFPFVLLILNIIGFTPIDKNYIVNALQTYTPSPVRPLLVQIVNELFKNVSGTVISITAIVAIWSASKGVLSIMFGFYEINKIHQKRNYFISRFVSMWYTIFFVISLVLSMTLLVFGNKLYHLLISFVPVLEDLAIFSIFTRYLVTFLYLTLFLVIIFKISNFRRSTIKSVFPGALLGALGWIVFSYVFSIYIDNFSNMTYMYGSLTAVIILMLWIYFCIYIIFIGAEINKLITPELASSSED